MSNPGFEPGTVCVLGRRDNHYTNWTGCNNLPPFAFINPKKIISTVTPKKGFLLLSLPSLVEGGPLALPQFDSWQSYIWC